MLCRFQLLFISVNLVLLSLRFNRFSRSERSRNHGNRFWSFPSRPFPWWCRSVSQRIDPNTRGARGGKGRITVPQLAGSVVMETADSRNIARFDYDNNVPLIWLLAIRSLLINSLRLFDSWVHYRPICCELGVVLEQLNKLCLVTV